MALGGGVFVTQNKILPGAYINFVSAARSNAELSERGIATIPVIMDWGALGEVVEVTADDLSKNSMNLFGYSLSAAEMKPIRELFRNIRIGYIYRLGTGGTKASNTHGTAKHAGVRGNKITTIIRTNVDDSSKKDVIITMDGIAVNSQTVTSAAQLVDDDFVVYKKDSTLAVTAGLAMAGGVNPTVTNANHQSYLNTMEGYQFNAIGCPSTDDTVKDLYAAFTKRLRDDQGVKFQCVIFDKSADHESVVNVMNSVTDAGADTYSLIYWVTGVIAGTEVNRSAQNKIYDGEYGVNINYTQAQLSQAIQGGKFAFHRVHDDIRVLADINSLVTLTAEKGEAFKENQTVRVIDQIANDIAVLFNTRYMGIIANNQSGRLSLWSDIVKHHTYLQEIGAIENFSDSDVTVEQGNTKRSVFVTDYITVVGTMAQLYMVVTVS